MEILSTWDYRGWKGLIKNPSVGAQKDWNSTILTYINMVAKKSGVISGTYVLVLIPNHFKSLVAPTLKMVENYQGSYNVDIHYIDSDVDIIEINGFGLKILNYSID